MRLFKYEGFKVVISPEALSIKCFKDIYDRDESEKKEIAMGELSFIYFYSDPRSDYAYIISNEAREAEIVKALGLPDEWKMDEKIKTAIEYYESFKPMSAMLLDDAYYMISKLRERMRTVDYDERDDKGKPVYTFESVTKTINQIPALVENLSKAMERVNKDITEQEIASGSVELTALDKDLDIFID